MLTTYHCVVAVQPAHQYTNATAEGRYFGERTLTDMARKEGMLMMKDKAALHLAHDARDSYQQ